MDDNGLKMMFENDIGDKQANGPPVGKLSHSPMDTCNTDTLPTF